MLDGAEEKSLNIVAKLFVGVFRGIFGILDVFFDYFSMISDICQFRWNLEAVVKYQRIQNYHTFKML